MTENEESFIHYAECIDSLNRAWSILHDLRNVDGPSAFHAAAFRYALIEYTKPYTRSDGTMRKNRKLVLPQLSPEHHELHKRILDLRDQVLAHCDLTLKQAKLHIFSAGNAPRYLIASNIAETLPSREAVISLIEASLDKMYLESERRLKSLSETLD
jgi:hypothetical protein